MSDQKTETSAILRIGVAIVQLNEQILVGIRGSAQHLAGRHEFPGGKCEKNESPEACAIRECREECGIEVEVIRLLHQEVFNYPERTVDLSFFLCKPINEEETKALTSPFQWLNMELLNKCNFPEGNQQILKILSEV